MGRRTRQRTRITAPVSEYRDAEGNVLVLRGSFTPKARMQYGAALTGGLEREDARQRALELLFERLAVSWTIAGISTSAQKDLLGRYRIAAGPERAFVHGALRRHVEESFPELEVP